MGHKYVFISYSSVNYRIWSGNIPVDIDILPSKIYIRVLENVEKAFSGIKNKAGNLGSYLDAGKMMPSLRVAGPWKKDTQWQLLLLLSVGAYVPERT